MKLKLEIEFDTLREMRTLLRNFTSDLENDEEATHYDYITDYEDGKVGIVIGFAKGKSAGNLIGHYRLEGTRRS